MFVEVDVNLPFPARKVWGLAGGFNLLPSISTGTTESKLEDGGRIRVLTNSDGSILWERLLGFSEADMTLSYEITDSDGFSSAYDVGYVGTVKVLENSDNGSIFRYSGNFEPTPGTTPQKATAAVEAFAQDCAAGIATLLERAPTP